MQPLLADRVGLKPPITEGYERAMGLVAASLSARDEKDFRQWPSHIGCDAHPQARDPFRSPSRKAPPLPPLLEGVADSIALAQISACSRIWSVPVPRACAVNRMAEAVSGILPS